jgi:hypothetical protein
MIIIETFASGLPAETPPRVRYKSDQDRHLMMPSPRYGNSVRDFVLQSEQIACRIVEALSPEMGVGLGID